MINTTQRLSEKTLTEKVINMVKEKIKALYNEASKKMRRNGISIPKAQTDEKSLFPSHLGKYVESKNIPLVIQ